jgi:hypothetical protein
VSDLWPSPENPRPALPRIEDLPVTDQGYDQEAVRAAFDSFYRHAAQLDASLRALEAVDQFQHQAGALRDDLRAIRSYSWDEPSWGSPYARTRVRPDIPEALPRIVLEFVFVIAVAVTAGVANFRPLFIVLAMAAAFTIVVVVEWLAERSRFVVPAAAPPAPVVIEAEHWTAPAEPVADAMTMIETVPQEAEPEPEPAPEPEAAPEPAPQPRRRWFRRGREETPDVVAAAVTEPPSHVRVLREEEQVEDEGEADPWERGFDAELEELEAEAAEALEAEAEPEAEAEADEPDAVEEPEAEPEPGEPGLSRIRRRRR